MEFEWLESYDYDSREWSSLDELREAVTYEIPDQVNVASLLCDRWALKEGKRTALFYEDETSGAVGEMSYSQLREVTNQLANHLSDAGVGQGDRVLLNTPQKRETLIAHLATWKIGAISVPTSTLFGVDAVAYRARDSGSMACICDRSNIETIREVRNELSSLEPTLVVGEGELRDGESEFWQAIESESTTRNVAETNADDPYIIIYTSGTTGNPKGVVHTHDQIVGLIPPTLANFYNVDARDDDVLWSATEWAWSGTLSLIYGAMLQGRPLLAYESGAKFDPKDAFSLIEQYDVTIANIPPTGLNMMMQVDEPNSNFDLGSLRIILSGGESLGAAITEWAFEEFDAHVHEIYGQTEAGPALVGDVTKFSPRRPGWMGFCLPGHEIGIVDPETAEVIEEPDTVGEIAVKRDDPTIFEEYWNKPEKTDEKFAGEWLLMEDLGMVDDSGRFKFVGRKDDVIISAGYRIGPEEIEDTILKHQSVTDVGVVGVPDDERGEVPKAFIVRAEDETDPDELKDELRTYVREQLAAYEYPRQISFVNELPRTNTGKIVRSQLVEMEK
jgi:acetyl-CoA synthetase